ncbi:MAG: hypothetical protein EXS37_03335 [Opitutus sp.]|nr:hypothetical protein [Opitutus sp.]
MWGGIAVAALVALAYWKSRPAATSGATPSTQSAAPLTKPSPKAGAKSVAVLPFANRSPDKENEFFTDGVHEDVITSLSNIRELRVISRTSVEQYRGTKKPVGQIGEELGVVYVLEGSVQREKDKVRITARLLEAATDRQLWQETFDRELRDQFAIQTAIATEMARALRTTLSPQEQKLIARRPTEDTAAYDLFLSARAFRNIPGSSMGLDVQIGLLEAAVKRDPRFAQAWADLARVYAHSYFSNFDHSDARLAQATVAMDTATRLAPEEPEVLLNLGYYYYFGFRDYGRATAEFEKMKRLLPNAPAAHYALGNVQRRQGAWLGALESYRKVAALDPVNVDCAEQLFSLVLAGRRYAEAREEKRRIAGLIRSLIAQGAKGVRNLHDLTLARLSYWESGSTGETEEFIAGLGAEPSDATIAVRGRIEAANDRGDAAEVVRLDAARGSSSQYETLLAAVAHAAGGDLAATRARVGNLSTELRDKLKREPANDQLWGLLGRIEAVLGDKEEALRCARQAVALMPRSRDAWDGPAREADLAFVQAWTGDKAGAIDAYARLLSTPVPFFGGEVLTIHAMKRSLWFVPLRGDPRWEALLADPKNNAPVF